jgi:hypothetical protein
VQDVGGSIPSWRTGVLPIAHHDDNRYGGPVNPNQFPLGLRRFKITSMAPAKKCEICGQESSKLVTAFVEDKAVLICPPGEVFDCIHRMAENLREKRKKKQP